MKNLRIVSINVIDSTNITVQFTESLSPSITVSNIVISSQLSTIPDPEVIKINISDNELQIVCQPLTPLVGYFVTFISTNTISFQSLNADAILLEDWAVNVRLIFGPIEENNPVKEFLINYLRENVYNSDNSTVVIKYIDALSTVLSKSLYDIRQSKNENYLSTTIIDELKTRSAGPFDRLNEESAYEVFRVSKNKTGTTSKQKFIFIDFPSDPISLQKVNALEVLTSSSSDKAGFFNINSFNITISKRFVIKLNSIMFLYSNGHLPYIYDIEKFGYQLLNSIYDTNSAFTYLLLLDNQIKLNDKILEDSNFSLQDILSISINYDYKDMGKNINPATILVDSVLNSVRETLPPIQNIFTLKHFPIVNSNDSVGAIGDIVFIDPNQLPGLNKSHPAFTREILFRQESLPARPGEYAVNYATGTIYIFGADTNNDGTGPFPPLATYAYRHTFVKNVDYVFDEDLVDLASLPNGNLRDMEANIYFEYEQVLAAETDYKAKVHQEFLNERVENKLAALNTIKVQNSPVTNVFRIFNETSGEVYQPIRWSIDKIFFSFNSAPNIQNRTGERATFENILHELLSVNEIFPIISTTSQIFKVLLSNNNIMANSEDCIGSSFNSSIYFSDLNVFKDELYFDNNQSQSQNLSRLTIDGYYQIDYTNGVVYCRVSGTQDFDIGTISYKHGSIVPEFTHTITVDDIYYRNNSLTNKNKHFNYIKFGEGFIVPSTFDTANEGYLNSDLTLPYFLVSSQVGAFVDAVFIPGVTNNIKFVRSIYEISDLENNIKPINFANATTINGQIITVSPLLFQEYHAVQFDGTNYFIFVNSDLFYQSSNITFSANITRLSDSAALWNGAGTLVLGSALKLILPGINSPQAGDAVLVNYSFSINNISRIIVDYNKGDYFIDYSYLADEILISYEAGDNVLDFRQSGALVTGDQYFVSYKVGALRDALLKNFGSLIDIPLLNNLDVSFERERYRDALVAAMRTFTQGPTLTAIKEIVSTISHTPPEIIESVFTNWSLGNSLLVPEQLHTTGEFVLIPAKFDNGVLMNNSDQMVTFPVVSNLRVEDGTFESWILPNWNGIDNDAKLKINIFNNGVAVPEKQIFIGPSEYHPIYDIDFELDTYTLFLDKTQNVKGRPNKTKDGVFIYYDTDISGIFDRWFIEVVDGYIDGYTSKNYKIMVNADGKVYDAKSSILPQPASLQIFSGTNTITANIKGALVIDEGITFVADYQHYIFDFGLDNNSNRFSIFKDESGYLNFKIYDEKKNDYTVSADISRWKAGQLHHIATAWTLNSKNKRDELHLFIDGLEVPNIIRYGDRLIPYLHEKFRTINPEEVVGVINKNIVASIDLITLSGSNLVSSSLNFSAFGILAGDTLFIEATGFSSVGYTIVNVNGNTLTLSVSLSITAHNLTFSVNKTVFNVITEIDIYPNIAVSLLHSSLTASDLSTVINNNIVMSSGTNFTTNQVLPGYLIRIDNINFAKHYTIMSVSGNSLTLSDTMPISLGSLNYFIYPNIEQEISGTRALLPAYTISKDINDVDSISIRDEALKNDIVLIRTLGINHKRIKKQYYVWGNTTNIIMTTLPSPVSLNSADITKIILSPTAIGPSNAIFGGVFFSSNNITTDQPSLSVSGRTLSISMTGDNVDLSSSVQIIISGTAINPTTLIPFPSTETFNFTDLATTQDTINKYQNISYVQVVCKPFNSSKNCCVVSVKEKYILTYPESTSFGPDAYHPAIRFSYQVTVGNTLYNGSPTTVTDSNVIFSSVDIGNYLVIHSPVLFAGTYQISSISADFHTLFLASPIPAGSFTGGIYEILNTTTYRSGLQNGFFTFEIANSPGTPYQLTQGLYEFEYLTYLNIPLRIEDNLAYYGTDINGLNSVNAVLDELKISINKLSDIRVGEITTSKTESITKDFNDLKPLKTNNGTLMLSHFDVFPFTNDTDTFISSEKNFIQSGVSVNDNFNKSICLTGVPLIIDNAGILNTKTEGTIEFWVNPLIDTGNDPEQRFYFDASSSLVEKTTSITNGTIKLANKASSIVNVRLQVGDQSIDYLAGGTLQSDGVTILLNRELPYQQTPVTVIYNVLGNQGDRVSIFKDQFSFVTFNIRASGFDYQVRAPIFWSVGTWHRLKAQYKINGGKHLDEMRFFIDGYEWGDVRLGTGLLVGQAQVSGSSFVGETNLITDIGFNDNINELYLGTDYLGQHGAQALIDNLKISNISRPIYKPFGESIDVNFISNTGAAFPVTADLNTTLLLNFETLLSKNTDFAIIKNRNIGLFDFSINVFDSFDIVDSNTKVKDILETLVSVLKPANSRNFIKYVR